MSRVSHTRLEKMVEDSSRHHYVPKEPILLKSGVNSLNLIGTPSSRLRRRSWQCESWCSFTFISWVISQGEEGQVKGHFIQRKAFLHLQVHQAPCEGCGSSWPAKATLTCLRCGQPGHFAANCPVPSKGGVKRPAAESVALTENAHVTFQDAQGHERPDVARCIGILERFWPSSQVSDVPRVPGLSRR